MWDRVALLAILAVCANAYTWDERTPLDDYVHYDDGYFEWKILTTYRFEENHTTVYMMNMTSQKWMDETLTDKPIWYHMMGIAVPDVIKHDLAMMWIEGGSNNDGTGPSPPDDWLVGAIVELADTLGCVAAYIRQVPNQRMVFTNDPGQVSRSEDKIIAWTWLTFITTHQDQPEVILRMPMTKAAKRGLDTINQLVAQVRPGTNIQRFVPSGGSKRGWTAWSLCATDRRVVGCIPVVMSLLNFNDTLQNHYRNLGGAWTWVFNDYWELNLTMHFHDEIVTKSPGGLWDFEDMFRYKERLGLIPKLMCSAAGDEFFMLTDSHAWWDQMPGEKWIMMVPNAEHSMQPWYRKIGNSMASFVMSILEGIPMPQLTWFRTETPTGGLLRFSTNIEPDEIAVWQAFTWRNDTRKDFRLAVGYPPYVHPVAWRRVPFQDLGFGNYLIETDRPDLGFTGFFFEAQWNYPSNLTLTLTSEAHVSPETFPGDPCYGVDCYGYLI